MNGWGVSRIYDDDILLEMTNADWVKATVFAIIVALVALGVSFALDWIVGEDNHRTRWE